MFGELCHASGVTIRREVRERKKQGNTAGLARGASNAVLSLYFVLWVDEVTWILLMYEDSLTRRLF